MISFLLFPFVVVHSDLGIVVGIGWGDLVPIRKGLSPDYFMKCKRWKVLSYSAAIAPNLVWILDDISHLVYPENNKL